MKTAVLGSLISQLSLSLLILVTFARLATAQPAPPPHSYVDPVLVGNVSGRAMATINSPSGFRVIVKTAQDTPVGICTVSLEFLGAPGIRGLSVQNAGVTINCAGKTMRKLVSTGSTTFAVRFGGFDNQPDVAVVADDGQSTVTLAMVPARSTDIDALGGTTGLSDLSLFSSAFLSATIHPEMDFDGSGGVPGLGDLSLFANEYLTGGTGIYCW